MVDRSNLKRADWQVLDFIAQRGGAIPETQVVDRAVRCPVFGDLLAPSATQVRRLIKMDLLETTEEDGDWTPSVQITDAGRMALTHGAGE